LYEPFDRHSTRECLDRFNLEPGNYRVHFDYEGWGEIDSVSWSDKAVVLPPAATTITSDLPLSWHYGQMPLYVWADVKAEGLIPIGRVDLRLVGDERFGVETYLRAPNSGRGKLWLWTERQLMPGTHQIAVVYQGGNGFLPSSEEKTVTVTVGDETTVSREEPADRDDLAAGTTVRVQVDGPIRSTVSPRTTRRSATRRR
jgi:hypothetical protein